MFALLGILCIVALVVFWCCLIHKSWIDRREADDDALIRAVNAYESPHDFSSDDCLGLDFGNYQPGSPIPQKPVDPAPMPAVFRRRSAGLWAFGGNAHQRRVFRRSIERAAA